VPGDTILELMTRVNIEPLKSAMTEASTSVAASTEKMKANFASMSASSVAANEGVRTMLSTLPPEFIKVEAGGVFAFEQIKRRVIESTSEVGALRQEILNTNDAAKLQQLNAQLDQARARMTAARTEMRAMRLEMTETREKADLLGESLGVKIPGSLGRLLGQIPLLQTAMNAAFAPLVVLFFADALVKVVEWIDNATASLAGYTEEVKKAFEEEKKANQEQLRHVGSVREGMEKIIETNRRVSEVGKSSFANFEESAKKAKAETSSLLNVLTLGLVEGYRTLDHVLTDVAHEQVVLSETAREQMKGLNEVTAAESRAALKNKENLEAAGQVGKSRLAQLREEISALNEKEALETKIANAESAGKKDSDQADRARAVANVEAEFAAKRLELQRHLAEEFASVSIAAAKSEVAARQAIESQFISFYESGLHQMYAAGQITLADEIAGEKAAAQQRLAIRRSEIEQQKALALREQSATGKDATPEVSHLDEERVRALVQTQQKLNEITQRGVLDALRQQNELNLAVVEGAKTRAGAEIAAAEESARAQYTAHKISLEQETAILKAAAAQRIDEDISVRNELLRQAQEFPEKNKPAIERLNSEIVAAERQKVTDLERIDAEYTSKHLEEIRREMEETLRFVEETSNRQLASELSADDKRLSSHRVTLAQWATLERDSVSRWFNEQSATLEAMLSKEKAIYGEDSLEYKKLNDAKAALDQERLQKLERINQQILSSEAKTWQTIESQFNRTVTEIVTGKEKVGRAFIQLWTEMLGDATQALLKIVEQFAISELRMLVLHTSGITQRQTVDNLWASLQQALGLKTSVQQTTQDARATTSHTVAVAQRQAADTTAAVATQTLLTTQGAAYTTNETAMTTAHSVALAARSAMDMAEMTARVASVLASNVAIVTSEAGAAGAAGFASVMEALPFPANISVAPGIMAAAIGITLGNLPLASARGGMDVEHDQLAFLHKREVVLPESIAQNFRAMHGAAGAPGAAAASGSGGGAGFGSSNSNNKTVNNHIRPTIIVNNPGTTVSQADIEKAVRKGVRSNALSFSP
jgi:hypothetical protein